MCKWSVTSEHPTQHTSVPTQHTRVPTQHTSRLPGVHPQTHHELNANHVEQQQEGGGGVAAQQEVLHSGGAPNVQRRQVLLQSPRRTGAQGAQGASATVSAGAPPHYNVAVARVWVVWLSANSGSAIGP
jgi:hypothetical protein